ncbi:MAG: hypothetical protein QW535_01785 [Candidatus Nezhaarchaeales archaeon]
MSGSSEKPILPPARAEDLSLKNLEKLPIIPPLRPAYEGICNGIKNVSEGNLNSAWFTVIGLYGSGKTFLLRRIAHEALQKYENVIPIYFYLGVKDEILLFNSLGKYMKEIEEYVRSEGKMASTRTHGEPKLWGERLNVLREVHDKVGKEKGKMDIELFFDAMKELNRRGYYPFVVLDEFERVVYTGEGIVGSELAIRNFDFLSQHFLELTRGHLFKGVGVLALTDELSELIRKAKEGKFLHVGQVEEVRIRDYTKLEIASPNIVFNQEYRLDWNSIYLDMLCKSLGISLPQDLIDMLSNVLPTPRTVITIANRARELGVEKVDRKSVYKLIEGPLETLIKSMRAYKTKSGRPLIFPTAKWDEWFKMLLEEGYYVINKSELPVIGKLIRKEEGDERKAHGFGRNVVNTLVNYGLYDKVARVYYLKRELMAYLLDIERLPSGDHTNLNRVLKIIESAVEERRERAKKYRELAQKASKKEST